jgi:hypothetical protein
MPIAYKQQVIELLMSIETGDEKPLAYINPAGTSGTTWPLAMVWKDSSHA